jgi:hypothetical protein
MNTRDICFLAALALVSACTTTPPPPATLTAKERYAEELLAIEPPMAMFAQLSESFIAAHSSPLKEKAHSTFLRHVDQGELDRIIRDALLKHFTEAELKALLDFYSTPIGRDCMSKVAPFAADVVPACTQEARRALRKAASEAAQRYLSP